MSLLSSSAGCGYTLLMRVLAIDPGYGRCGVAVVEKKSGRYLTHLLVHIQCIYTRYDAL